MRFYYNILRKNLTQRRRGAEDAEETIDIKHKVKISPINYDGIFSILTEIWL